MKAPSIVSLIVALLLFTSAANASQTYTSIGGDVYVAGSDVNVSSDAPRDVFAAGFSPSVTSSVAGDLHVAGFSVDVTGSVGQDLYVVGASVSVNGAIQDDLTASGFSVAVNDNASVGGNARLAAGSLSIGAPISGSLVAGAGEVRLDSVVNGDVTLSAQDLSFGPNAKILGKLSYSSSREITVPASVISADRVSFRPLQADIFVNDMHETMLESVDRLWPTYLTVLSGFLITLTFLLIVAALFLAFAPEAVYHLRKRVQHHLFKAMLFGVVGLAILIGLLPVSVSTIVGIPFVPFILLAIVVVWTLGYLLGAYALSMRVAEAFGRLPDSAGGKLLVLGLGLFAFSVLNFIPIIGWLVNYAIVLLGLGAITASLFSRYNWTQENTRANNVEAQLQSP